MKVDTPLTESGPCSCSAEDMELEEQELQSTLTGALYDTIRCGSCKTVFAAQQQSDCDCGGTPNGGHLRWCDESDSEWPPMNQQPTEEPV